MLVAANSIACAPSRGSLLTGQQQCLNLTYFESSSHGGKELVEAIQVGTGAGLEGSLIYQINHLNK